MFSINLLSKDQLNGVALETNHGNVVIDSLDNKSNENHIENNYETEDS